jgi:hypothetical protein
VKNWVSKFSFKCANLYRYIEVCLFHGLEVHEEVLGAYAGAMRDMDLLWWGGTR